MKVVLFRHGIATDREDPACPPDPERALTPKGAQRTGRAARGLARLGLEPGLILTSPYLRARQTAEIVARALGYPREELVITESLLPDAEPVRILRELRGRRGDVVLVGHAPHLDDCAALLLGLPGGPPFRLRKAGALCVERDSGDMPGRLLWLLEPDALRRMGT